MIIIATAELWIIVLAREVILDRKRRKFIQEWNHLLSKGKRSCAAALKSVEKFGLVGS